MIEESMKYLLLHKWQLKVHLLASWNLRWAVAGGEEKYEFSLLIIFKLVCEGSRYLVEVFCICGCPLDSDGELFCWSSNYVRHLFELFTRVFIHLVKLQFYCDFNT